MTTPAGWYDDGAGSTRYWDGTAWTAHVAPAATQPAATPPAVPQPAATPPAVPQPAVPHAAYAHATYPAQPSSPTTSGSKLPLFIGIGVGAVVLAGGAFFGIAMLLGGGSGPREAFDSYYAAAKRGDCEGMYEMTVASVDGPPASEYCEGAEYESFEDDEYSISVESVEEDGDTAELTVSATYQNEDMEEPATETSTFVFERVDGTWLFSRIGSS